MNINDFLPLGSVVSLKNGEKKLFIIGINQKAIKNDKVYDYCACLHPYGYLNSEDIFLFDRDKIDKIYFKGFFDEETKEYYEDIVWERKRNEGGY